MAFKRNIDRLPIIPADAKPHNVTCHFCIVGCGYQAYTWPVNKQGGTEPSQNVFKTDLSKQQSPQSPAWYSPSMYNIVQQDGRDVHVVIKPDHACQVNSGLGSIRGARMAETSYSRTRGTQQQRLTQPLVWRYGQAQPTSWDDALDLVARVTVAVIKQPGGEDNLLVSAFDHGGAGGGYENTWGTGKLYFGAMKVKNIRIHNRPAYNSEVHATRDMGVGELNNCYEDAQLADTIVAVGCNPLETQTNYFLNHWVPNLRGTSLDLKRKEIPGEDHAPGRIVIVDPRRTATVAACEAEAGPERVLHLAIEPGTDLVLFNAWATYIDAQGWTDKAFIAASTKGYAEAIAGNQTLIEDAARITGLSAADIIKAAEWIAAPKGGQRRRTMLAYEKGLIWGNDNYRTNAALVNVALATGNLGRPGGGCVRMGGHQEGYSRPSDAHVGRPAANVDALLLEGKGGVHHIWGCDHYKTTLNAHRYKQTYKRRTDIVKAAMDAAPPGDRKALVEAIIAAIGQGGLFAVNVDIVPTKIGEACHVILPAATSGEMNLTSMNGERRMRLTERYMDAPGQAMADCLIAARLANRMEAVLRELGDATYADQFKGFDWTTEEDAFNDGYAKHENGGEFVTYARLKAMGTNGFQEPATGFENGRIAGTKRLFADGKFGGKDGKATFMSAVWRGLQAPGKQQQKDKFAFLINNGRANHIWQSAYLDQASDLITDRFPYPIIEIHPDDMAKLGLKAGDLAEITNDDGATQAMAYPTPSAKRGQTFMIFAHPNGVQGNVVNAGTNELMLPNYKQTWANIRKLADAPSGVAHVSFKDQHYKSG